MDDSSLDPAEHFIKQRRNLIVTSILVIFFHASGLKFKQDFDYAGTHVELAHPEVIGFFLAIFFFYFLWRYFTACNQISGLSVVQSNYSLLLSNYAYAQAIKTSKKISGLNFPNDYSVEPDSLEWKKGWLTFHPGFLFKINRVYNPMTGLLPVESIPQFSVSGMLLWRYKMVAIFVTFFGRPAFAEYVLPYMIAGFAIIELPGWKVMESFLHKVGVF